MIQKLILSLFALVFAFQSFSQTTINANSQVSGTWTKSGSPYLIKGNISVPKNSTLVIEAGVQVRFDGKYMMGVYGNIKAMGAEGDTIRFYPQDTMNRWLGIRYFGSSQASDSAQFEYCRFEYCGPKLSNFENALKLSRGHFLVNHCKFNNNTSVLGVNSLNTDSVLSLEIKNSIFYRNININTNPSITQQIYGVLGMTGGFLRNCIFKENGSKNPYNSLDNYQVDGQGSGGIIYVSDHSNPNAKIEINGCQFIKNNCALRGAGVDINLKKSGQLQIKNCSFTNNQTGRYGCVTYIGRTADPKSNVKLIIDSCYFGNNSSANTFVADGVSCIALILFKSNDSAMIKNCLFESNTARSTVTLGTPNEGRQYLINNVFRGNALWCVAAENSGDVWSINNLYHNNMSLSIAETNNSIYYFRSINDAYLYNGPNIDTFALDQRLLSTYKGQYYRASSTFGIFSGTSASFKNCIFWQNRNYNGRIEHIDVYNGRIKEISNCIFEGNPDSSILWSNDLNPNRPNPLVLTYQNNINANPLFVNPPSTYGPNGLNGSIDFHLLNTCSQLSPAYNKGSNQAISSWAGLGDKDNKTRIDCDTIDIGPYEMGEALSNARITYAPQDFTACDNQLDLSIWTTCNPNSSSLWQYKDGANWTTVSNGNRYQPFKGIAGLYRAIYTQSDCNLSDTSREVQVSILPSPIPFLGNDTTIEESAVLTLDAGDYPMYLWQDATTDRTFTLEGEKQGVGTTRIYYVMVRDHNGCMGADTISISVTWNSSIGSILNQDWKVYPNPGNGVLNIESPNGENFQWQLFNLWGAKLQEGSAVSITGIDIREMPSGTYLIQIQYGERMETIKILKN